MKKGIVCVDDEAILVACMKQDILSRYGGEFICETSLGGGEALVVIDELLSEGVELLRRVREKCPEAGVMVVSGQADDQEVRLMREKFDRFAYIEKPWKAKRLFSEIDRLLDGKAAQAV